MNQFHLRLPRVTTTFAEAHAATTHPVQAGLQHHDVHYGLDPVHYAFIFGIASGLSLPIGSALGIYFSPVSDKTCALMMAFGAGALLFAVTVELYGHALHELSHGRLGLFEMFTTIFGALLGASFYLTVNKMLDSMLGQEEKAEKAELGISPTDSESPSTDAVNVRQAGKALRDAHAAHEKQVKANAKKAWAKVKTLAKIGTFSLLARGGKNAISKVRGREKAMRAALSPEELHAKFVAFALFVGLLVDGVPEGVLMGFLAAEGHLTPVLIISLFVANFPEAFSSASLLIEAKMAWYTIISMWCGLCLLVGCLCGFSCYFLLLNFPSYGGHGADVELPLPVLLGIALVEGITGGAMIACIASVMLPEAFERAGQKGPFYQQSGFLCTAGFLMSVALKATFG